MLRAFLARLLAPPEPPTLQSDWDRLRDIDGLHTDYLSLDERRAFDRLCAAGHAERRLDGGLGMHVFHRIELREPPPGR